MNQPKIKTDKKTEQQTPSKVFSASKLELIKDGRKNNVPDDYIAWQIGCEVSDLPPKEGKPQ